MEIFCYTLDGVAYSLGKVNKDMWYVHTYMLIGCVDILNRAGVDIKFCY